MLKQLAVSGVVDRLEGGWVATGAEWSYDHEHYDGVVAVRRREADIMRSYVRGERCLMELLQESLDDPAAEPCGRCSVCRGALPEAFEGAPSATTVATITGLLRGQVHVLEPRKMWPGGAFGSRGRIPPDEAHAPGRTLVFADAPEWRETRRGDVRAGRAGTAGRARRLRPAARPVALVVAGASRGGRRPHRDGLPAADRVGRRPPRRGRSPGPGVAAGPSAPPDLRELSSADEAAFWRDHLDASGAAGAVAGRAVLLVVDASSSLWPVTMAAAVLRRSGAAVVLPLLLHRRP